MTPNPKKLPPGLVLLGSFIDGTTKLGVGTTAPTHLLHVAGALRVDAATTAVAPGAGGAGALPATPAGYVTVNIGGVDRKLAYY